MQQAARQFIEYVNKSPSPYHAVEECRTRLLGAGFQELRETEHWTIQPKQKYFFTRNKSTMIAFAVGGQYKPGNGFSMVGAHTDSPCLKVKPDSKKIKNGYLSVGVECYGGGIWHTWMDRDLKIAGRVIVKNGDKLVHKLVHINRPIMFIPNCAIHLLRTHNENFSANKETQLVPVLATCVQMELLKPAETGEKSGVTCVDKHHSLLSQLLCDELKVSKEQLVDFELFLADAQPSVIGGALDEFLLSPRLDNLLNAYCAMEGLITSVQDGDTFEKDPNIRMINLYDNEEVGSQSAHGAESSLTEFVMRRLSAGGTSTSFEEAIPKSFLVSADQAHAVHPNYPEKHEDNHKVAFHKGVVFKINSNQRYATTAVTSSILRVIAEKANVPLQDFVVRCDMPCGTTIGPIISAKLGLRTIDIGMPQLGMHSIREMACTSSIYQATSLYKAFFEHYPAVNASLEME
ncbi:aspartyl aminopeptidase-like [Glandiceps talaboti]